MDVSTFRNQPIIDLKFQVFHGTRPQLKRSNVRLMVSADMELDCARSPTGKTGVRLDSQQPVFINTMDVHGYWSHLAKLNFCEPSNLEILVTGPE